MTRMTQTQHATRRATPAMVAKAVLSAFVGIRGRSVHEREAVTITPVQAVIAGLAGAAVFVATLLTVVWLVTK